MKPLLGPWPHWMSLKKTRPASAPGPWAASMSSHTRPIGRTPAEDRVSKSCSQMSWSHVVAQWQTQRSSSGWWLAYESAQPRRARPSFSFPAARRGSSASSHPSPDPRAPRAASAASAARTPPVAARMSFFLSFFLPSSHPVRGGGAPLRPSPSAPLRPVVAMFCDKENLQGRLRSIRSHRSVGIAKSSLSGWYLSGGAPAGLPPLAPPAAPPAPALRRKCRRFPKRSTQKSSRARRVGGGPGPGDPSTAG